MSKISTELLIPLVVPAVVFAGAWTMPTGKMWIKVTVLQQHTDEAYLASTHFSDGKLFHVGDNLAYPFDGEFDSEAVFIDAVYGGHRAVGSGHSDPLFRPGFCRRYS